MFSIYVVLDFRKLKKTPMEELTAQSFDISTLFNKF